MRDEQQWEELIPPAITLCWKGLRCLPTGWWLKRSARVNQFAPNQPQDTGSHWLAFDDPAYVTWIAYNPEPETRDCVMVILP